MATEDKTIALGHPSYIWREGQERRLSLMRRYVRLEGARVLDVGCGLGLFVQRFSQLSNDVHGVEVDAERARAAGQVFPNIVQASAERLPYADGTFDAILSHEVLEHVGDDRAAVAEACRTLKPGGRLIVFVPNRLYPFETHGIFWRGRYHYGNIPLVNYLPDGLRRRLCPHVRAYRQRELVRLFAGLPGKIVVRRCVFAGYDNIVERHPRLGRLLRHVTYALESTPLQFLGLSHLLVFEREQPGRHCQR